MQRRDGGLRDASFALTFLVGRKVSMSSKHELQPSDEMGEISDIDGAS